MSHGEMLTRAREVAATAAERAGVQVFEPGAPAAMGEVAGLLDGVWGRAASAGRVMSPEALTALARAGGQVSVALRDDRPVGATAALIGLADDGEVFLHSHVTGVRAEAVGAGVGQALKWHQRAWALARGIGRVRWTFDPLVRRNAVLNLVVLGARATSYLEDAYGQMDDQRNGAGPTDRLEVDWELDAARVTAAAGGRAATPDLDRLRGAGAHESLRIGLEGEPHLTPSVASRQLVQIPPDIETIRATDPPLATAWAAAVRHSLGDAVTAGARITGCTRDGWYVLATPSGIDELAGR